MAGRNSYLQRTIRRNSVRKGLFGGSRFWLAIFAAGYVARWTGTVTKRGTMTVRYSEPLAPGEAIVIRHFDESAGPS